MHAPLTCKYGLKAVPMESTVVAYGLWDKGLATGWRPSVDDWGGWYVCLLQTAGPTVHWRRQWMAA